MPSRQPDQASAHADLQARLDGLDDLLEHRSRLAACVLLSKTDQLSFSRLKAVLGETDGNLGAQLRKLEEAGYLAANKEFLDRRPVTWYRLTAKGRKALLAHVDAFARVIGHAAR